MESTSSSQRLLQIGSNALFLLSDMMLSEELMLTTIEGGWNELSSATGVDGLIESVTLEEMSLTCEGAVNTMRFDLEQF